MKKLHKSRLLLPLLLTGVILLAVAGAALLGAYVLLARNSGHATIAMGDLLEAAHPNEVAPDLAILTLAGEPDDRVIRAALDANEFETAYAVLAYSVQLPDAQRGGHWLLVAERLRTVDAPRAIRAYVAALDQAALAPAISDLARVDMSLQIARGFTALEQKEPARLALVQAEGIARYSPTLLPAQRRTALTQIIAAYQTQGDSRSAQALRAELDSPGPAVRVEPAPLLLPALRGGAVLPYAVATTMAQRQQAAAALAARWLSSSPSTRTTLADKLGQALIAEDAARASFYSEMDTVPLTDRLALLHDRVMWLTVKYRAARGAYGVPLVSAWTPQADELAAQLAAAYTDLVNGYGVQLDTLTAPDEVLARVELLRQAVLWTRLGLFPGNAEPILSEQLTTAAQQLWTRQGGVGLTIVVQAASGGRFYLLSGAQPNAAPAKS